jgi:predicted GNAT family N-acyltransferase
VTVELFDIRDAERLGEALAIRLRVFVDEQAVPLELEIDEHDRTDTEAVHALVREGDATIGTGRFYVLDPSSVQVGRMAVAADWRGRGAGACLLGALMIEARRRGFNCVRLEAQTAAVEFYRKAGFEDDGEPLWDAGILHQPMVKQL